MTQGRNVAASSAINIDTRPQACPVCGYASYRIQRRWVDRMTSLFRPVLRYRCRSMRCGWEGNRCLDTGAMLLEAGAGQPLLPEPGARFAPPTTRGK